MRSCFERGVRGTNGPGNAMKLYAQELELWPRLRQPWCPGGGCRPRHTFTSGDNPCRNTPADAPKRVLKDTDIQRPVLTPLFADSIWVDCCGIITGIAATRSRTRVRRKPAQR